MAQKVKPKFITDHLELTAVVANSEMTADFLGYSDISETEIERLEFVNHKTGEIKLTIDVGPRSYRDAIWVEYYCKTLVGRNPNDDLLVIDYIATYSLKIYIGVIKTKEAYHGRLENNQFAHETLTSGLEPLLLKIIRKTD